MNWFVVTSLFWRKLAVYSYLWSALNITSKVTNISLKAIGLQYCENRTKRRPTTLSPQIKIQLTNSIIVIIIIMNLNEKYNRLISLIWANVNIPSPTVEIKTTEIATHTPIRRHNFVFCFFFTTISSVETARRCKGRFTSQALRFLPADHWHSLVLFLLQTQQTQKQAGQTEEKKTTTTTTKERLLDNAAVAIVSVEDFQFSVDGRANGGCLFLGHEVSLRLPPRNFDPRPVDQERVVQNHEIVVQDAQRVALIQNFKRNNN